MLTRLALSQIMLIKIKHGKKMKFTIPVVLVVFDELLEILEDWIWIFEGLFPSWKQKSLYFGGKDNAILEFSLRAAFGLVEGVFFELRKHRDYKMVEVDAKDVYFSIELL